MKKVLASRKSKVVAAVTTLFVLLVAGAAGVFFYYGSHALPGTKLAGHDVGGQTRAQVRETIDTLVADQNVELVSPEGESTEVDLAQAGVFVDAARTVDAVFGANEHFASRVKGIFSSPEVEPVVVVNYALLDDYASSIESSDEIEATNAKVSFDAEAASFTVSESATGFGVDTEAVEEALLVAAGDLSDTVIDVSLVDVDPDLPTDLAQAAADSANAWLALDIQTTDADGSVATAEPAVVASWVEFVPVEDSLETKIKEDAVEEWVTTFAEASNREVENGVQNVNSSGAVVSTAKEGVAGRAVENIEAITEAIVAAFGSGSSFSGEFAYTEIQPAYDQRLIADGAEDLAYQAAPGERWIDINLSNYHVTGYEGATPVMRMPMVPGAPLTPTITGEYAVYAKVPIQTMRGNNVDGSRYETPNVPWVLYFQGGYALHGAYWRSSFGYDAGSGGSHGCVNLPVDQAKELYDFASIGDKVISHY